MKRTFLILLFATVSSITFGQRQWTLQECVDYAIANNIQIKQQELSVEGSEIELNSSINSRLPSLSAGASQNFNFGRSPSMATGVYEQNTSASTGFSVSSNVSVFNGMRISNQIKGNEINLMAATEGLKKAKENLALNVASYYLDILFKKELLKIAEQQYSLTEKQVERTQILANEGGIPASQVYDIKSQLARDDLNVTNARNDLTLSLLNLSQLLNLNDNVGFDITEPLITMEGSISTLQNPDRIYNTALSIKPHVKEAEYKLESSRIDIKIAKSNYWPSVSFGASYNNGFNHIFDSGANNTSISDQISNNQRQALGLNLSIPIFNRFQTRNQVRMAQLATENMALELDNIKLSLYKEIQQAYQSALAAQSRYTSTGKAYEAAQEAYRYAEERYELRMLSAYDFNEARTKLATSLSEQAQAKYDFIFRSKILDFYMGEQIEL
jgi:Outer membrane protein